MLVLAASALAQDGRDRASLARAGAFLTDIPAPESVLGFEPGSRPASFLEAEAFYRALASKSDRVQLRDYGRSSSGRKLFVLIISAPENLARLDTLRAQLRRLGERTLSPGEAKSSISRLPATAWLGYGIHGDEISGPDAALELAYRLASSQSESTLELLRNLVIHIDVMANPDGRDRSVTHLRSFGRRMASPDPQDLAYAAIWPTGRGNRYLFDLNRDALYTVQQESRARVAAILEASPQLLVDAHEMQSDDTFLFAVPAEPLNPLLPRGVHASWQEFAADHARAFDGDGTSFYTRSWNEVFYPGYFDIWPAYHGAVPIIYEQATTAGTTLRLPNGRQRSYAESVEHQLRSSLASLATAARNRTALLARWREVRLGVNQGDASPARAWLILPTDHYKLGQAARTLLAQGLTVERLQHPVRARNLRSVWDEHARSVELPAGTLLVRSEQPMGRVAHNLLDFHISMPSHYLREERRRLDAGRRSQLYDATAWSLPHAFASDVLWSAHVPAGDWVPVLEASDVVAQVAVPTEAVYGYLYRDPSLLATGRLLQQGVKVRFAREKLQHEGSDYDAGTLLIRNDDQAGSVFELIKQAQNVDGARFASVNSARILRGPDLGDRSFLLLRQPRIALAGGQGFEDTSVGAVIHLFDVTAGIPVTLLDFAQIDGLDLRGYDVLILPDVEDESRFAARLEAGQLAPLRRWVERGGTLIALRGATLGLAAAGFTAAKLRASVIDTYPPLMFGRSAETVVAQDFLGAAGASGSRTEPGERALSVTLPVIGAAARPFVENPTAASFTFPSSPPLLPQWLEGTPAAEQLKASGGALLRRYLPRGAYLRVELRSGHWLAAGVPTALPSLFREPEALIAGSGSEIVGRYSAPVDLALSGLLWPEAVGYIAGTAQLVRERLGEGQVILFSGDPLFRGYSLGTQRLFLNAVFLGPAFPADGG